ncbi:MAG TPA: hypothetical protein PK756_22930 [Piscinibacter sp.]|jgi:hypothetical protein|nr:hypothetical protein [Piscinibacter sp.]
MKVFKRVLRPERLRQVPEQFSWVDQALVQHHLIDRLDAQAALLYLFLVTVADAQGLSYYGGATLAQRLRLRPDELVAARAQLVGLDLIAYEAPLYQVLGLPGAAAARAPRPASAKPAPPSAPHSAPMSAPPPARQTTGPVSLGDLLGQLERRRARL